MTRTIDVKEATQPLSEYAQHADEETLVVTSKGRPIAALVPVQNADLETISLGQNPEFLEIIEASRESYRQQGGVPLDEVRRRLSIPKRPGDKAG